ncbi:MAG: SDR family NAD(P)-dependent oxidoreductase, partial [Caldisphaera sp.]|nr:SDR family NAD(P)-dependent oxidoreductase [Caldisphaera sp.]
MKVALVTGGDRGIGRAIVIRLSSPSVFTIISYRKREDEAKSTLDYIKSRNGQGDVIKADISSKEDVENMVNYIKKKYGGIDILVNNAGVGFSSKFNDLTYDSWFKQIQTNLTGSFYITKLLIDNMINK